MNVGVGSGNPVKVEATRRALPSEHDEFGRDAVVESEPVPSGVSEQPRGHGETRRGAVNRAVAVLDERSEDGHEYDLGVGIEGGVTDEYGAVETDRASATTGGETIAVGTELSLIMWAAVTDGERTGVGAGPTIPLPATVATRVREGAELGPVMDDVLGQSGVATDQGAAGAVTGRRVDRTSALESAVASALAPFVTELYD
jgi:inosine/xanthosine triphosphatase